MPDADAARRLEARRWLGIADRDRAAARGCAEMRPPLLDIAAYHCQQALEKIAKGYLVLAGVPFRRTHSVDELAGQLAQIDPAIASEFTRLAWVTSWGFVYRYPEEEPQPPPSRDEIDAVLATVDALGAALRMRLKPAEGLGDTSTN